MSFDVLAILFILFSIGSSLLNKYQTRRAEQERQNRRSGPPDEEEEDDLFDFDWGRLEQPEPEPIPPEPQREVGDVLQEALRVLVERQAEAQNESAIESDETVAYDEPVRKVRGRRRLRLDRRAAIRGILYAEILGPPRAVRPAGEDWE